MNWSCWWSNLMPQHQATVVAAVGSWLGRYSLGIVMYKKKQKARKKGRVCRPAGGKRGQDQPKEVGRVFWLKWVVVV